MKDEASVAAEAGQRVRLSPTVIALGWVSLLTDVASEMIYPLLPRFLESTLGAGKVGVGLIEGVAETAAALLRLPSGVWSDRLARRKPLIVAGYGIAGMVRPLIGLATAPWHALAIRFVDRVGKGVRGAPRDAMMADVTPAASRGRAFGFHRAMDHAGAALGPLLAYAFLRYFPGEFRPLFLCAMVPGALVLMVLLLAVREPSRKAMERKDVERQLPDVKSDAGEAAGSRWQLSQFDPRFRWYLAALVLFVLGNSSDAFLLLRAEQLGIAAVNLPLLWCGFHVAKSLANLGGGRLADRVSPRALVLVGWGIYGATYLGFGLAASAWHVIGLYLSYAVYYGLTEPAEKLLVARWSPHKMRGAGFGWYNLAVGVGALPASLVFGAIWEYWPQMPIYAFGFGAVLALIAAIILAATSMVRPKPTW